MANELNIAISASYRYPGTGTLLTQDPAWIESQTLQVTQSVRGADGGERVIGTAEENITFTDITTNGYFWIKHVDSANTVNVGYDDAGTLRDLITLASGQIALFPIKAGRVIRAIAVGGNARVKFKVLNA